MVVQIYGLGCRTKTCLAKVNITTKCFEILKENRRISSWPMIRQRILKGNTQSTRHREKNDKFDF